MNYELAYFKSPHDKPPQAQRFEGYSSIIFATQHQEVGGQKYVPADLSLEKIRYPLYGRQGGSRGRSGWHEKSLPHHDYNPRTFQPVVSRYTEYTITSARMM